MAIKSFRCFLLKNGYLFQIRLQAFEKVFKSIYVLIFFKFFRLFRGFEHKDLIGFGQKLDSIQ